MGRFDENAQIGPKYYENVTFAQIDDLIAGLKNAPSAHENQLQSAI